MKTRGIYLHIPFCLKKCNYCDFVSFIPSNREIIGRYKECLKQEISLYGAKYSNKKFTSIYFGGGTPTTLEVCDLIELLEMVTSVFNICESPEITIEANPGTINYQKASQLKSAGFNRISLGVQSLADQLLIDMGRVHTVKDVEEALRDIQKAGFNNFNLDLIYGLPEQTVSEWLQTLKRAIAFNPPHLSTYGLKVEENTFWGILNEKGKLKLPTEDDIFEMYTLTEKFLHEKGYRHYEISNWARPGYECEHNKVYWLTREYLGLGLNSTSYLDGVRFTNTADFNEYLGQLQLAISPVKESQILNRKEQISDTMIMGLRLADGVNKEDFKKRYGRYPQEYYSREIKKLVKMGLLSEDAHSIKLTSKGIPLANLAMVEFV